MKVGVFGGTFSPPHNGHFNAAVSFMREMKLDSLLIVPAAVPPNKEGLDLLPARHRLAMCRIAFAKIPGCEVSSIELDRGGTSYTYETLPALSAPDRELYLMMGTDMFLTLDTWRRPDEILRLATVVVASRSFDPVTAEAIAKKREELLSVYKGSIVFLKNRICEFSSTFLREKIAAGESVSDRLDDDVLKYIEKEKLYDV